MFEKIAWDADYPFFFKSNNAYLYPGACLTFSPDDESAHFFTKEGGIYVPNLVDFNLIEVGDRVISFLVDSVVKGKDAARKTIFIDGGWMFPYMVSKAEKIRHFKKYYKVAVIRGKM